MADRTILDRILERLDVVGLTERGASLATDRGPDVIRNIRRAIERGETYAPRTDTLDRLAKVLQTTPEWLIRESGSGELAPPPLVAAERAITGSRPPPDFFGPRDLKVFSATEGGPGELVVSTDPIDIVIRPWYLEHVPEGYAVMVTGESMIPVFRPGHLAIVNPRLPPMRNEDHIFVAGEEHGEFRATIKHLLAWTARDWQVEQFNPPEGTDKAFALAKVKWPKALRVVGSYRR